MKQFIKNTEGNVALMFTFAIAALMVCIGAAVDFSAAAGKRQSLQDMIDAATLAAAKSKETDRAKLLEIAETVVAQHNTENWPITLDLTVTDDVVMLSGAMSHDAFLMGMVDNQTMDIGVSAASPIASLTPVRIALVLDTTDSMAGSNISALKSAANAMIDEFADFEAPIAASIVPFGQYVNVGMGNRLENWLDVSMDGTTESYNHCWRPRTTITAPVCTPTGNTITRDVVSDGVVTGQSSYNEQSCTAGVYDYGPEQCEIRTRTYTWAGCVGSRTGASNIQAAYGGSPIPGIMNVTGKPNENCGTELMELSRDRTALKAKINSLTTSGDTYMPSGVMWGWRTLQSEVPFMISADANQGVQADANPVYAMVIMTDGENTLSQGGDGTYPGEERHRKKDEDAANARTLDICNNAKTDGIVIFTVGYRMENRDDAKAMLQDCASTAGSHFNADNASELKDAFKSIASALDQARLSM